MSSAKLTPEALGQWALVVGGSSGIGREIANGLAQRGFDLVLVSRNPERLEIARQELRAHAGVDVETLAVDVSAPDAASHVINHLGDRAIGVYVTTAGEGRPGRFTESNLEDYLACVNVKIRTVLTISHHLATHMRERGRGAMLLTSSTGALQGVSGLANNAASESYVLGLGESLHHELKQHGVRVTVLMPGPTLTAGMLSMLPEGAKPPRGTMSAEVTAAQGLKALEQGKSSHIAGWHNRAVMHLVPRKARSRLMSSMVAPWVNPQADTNARTKVAA